jgi:hypothetical protein
VNAGIVPRGNPSYVFIIHSVSVLDKVYLDVFEKNACFVNIISVSGVLFPEKDSFTFPGRKRPGRIIRPQTKHFSLKLKGTT